MVAADRWVLPIRSPLVTDNDRLNRWVHASRIKAIRKEVWARARHQRIPNLDRHCHVQLILVPSTNRRRDAENLNATLKPAVDGLQDAGVITDDTPDLVATKRTFITDKNYADLSRGLWLLVERLTTPIINANPLAREGVVTRMGEDW